MNVTGKILAVDDNEDILISLKLLLKPHVESIVTEINPENIDQLLLKNRFDVILLDMNFKHDAISGQEGLFWLEKILDIDPDAVVIFITAYGNTEKAVRAIKAGAADFILKPWQNEKLLATVMSGIRLRESRTDASQQRNKVKQMSETIDTPFKDIIGGSAGMKKVLETIRKVAVTDASILVLGENGTGKEVVARAIHRSSPRSEDVFINVDLGAIPDTLFESELFGYEKGAFTDAKQAKEGRFEVATGGTLFLDEIGNLTLPMQAKLLTVIERRQVVRLGSTQTKNIDIRLICATNSDIYEMVENGDFRQDLLYRVNTVEIHIPPLRERVDDIPLLAEHYFNVYTRKYKKRLRKISAAAMKELQMYNWPGNIRELQHSIERAVIMSEGMALEACDFILSSQKKQKSSDFDIDTYNLDEIEKRVIKMVLDKTHGNVSIAAKQMGLTRTSLYRRIEKHGL
jgi:two-component system response regulator HydG